MHSQQNRVDIKETGKKPKLINGLSDTRRLGQWKSRDNESLFSIANQIMETKDDLMNEHIGKWVAMIHLTVLNLLDHEMRRFGLSQSTFGYLIGLYINDGQRQDQLFREIDVNKSTVARAVQKLEKLGYVRREPEQRDRRVVRVFLTAKALAIREELIGILKRHSEIMVHGFTKQQAEELIATLKKVYKNIQDYKNGLTEKNGREHER